MDKSITIPCGNGAFINKNVVHMVLASADCHYKSFLFPKQLVSFRMGSPAYRYVERILECGQIGCVAFKPSVGWQDAVLNLLKELSDLENSRTAFYEYEVLVLLSRIWLLLAKNLDVPEQSEKNETERRMQQFLTYIE